MNRQAGYIEDETSADCSKVDAVVPDHPGKGFTQRIPGRSGWIDDAGALVVRLQNNLFQLTVVSGWNRAGPQLGGDHRAEIQAGGGHLDESLKVSGILVVSRCGDETVRIQYKLAHPNRFGRALTCAMHAPRCVTHAERPLSSARSRPLPVRWRRPGLFEHDATKRDPTRIPF